jgi:hypothetical protein
MGTDAGQLWFLAMLAVVAVPALGLLGTRLVRSGSGGGAGAGHGQPAAGQPQMSKNRPSGQRLTTGVVPIPASRPQH